MEDYISMFLSEYAPFLLILGVVLLLKYVPKYLHKRKVKKLKYE
jgi:hypothetical protein